MSSREFRYPLDAQNLEELKDAVWDLYSYILPFDISVTTDYTTSNKVGWEYIFADSTATGTQTITLHSGAKDKQRKTVKKSGSHGGAVQVDTEGSETIDGTGTDTVTDVTTYIWTATKDEWSKV